MTLNFASMDAMPEDNDTEITVLPIISLAEIDDSVDPAIGQRVFLADYCPACGPDVR